MKLRCNYCNGGNRFNMHVHLAHNAFSRLALTLESQNSFSFQILRDLSLANKETLTVFAHKQMVSVNDGASHDCRETMHPRYAKMLKGGYWEVQRSRSCEGFDEIEVLRPKH